MSSHFLNLALKRFVTVSFICGAVSIIVKVLDEKLSDDSKKRFGEWITGLTPKLSSLNLDTLYLLTKTHGLRLFAIVFTVAWVWIFASSAKDGIGDRVFGGALGLIASCLAAAILRKAFRPPTFREARIFIFQTGLAAWIWFCILFEILWAIQWYFEQRPKPDPEHISLLVTFLIPITTGFMIAFFLASPSILLLFVVLLRGPILLLARAARWMVNYQKGPWAGLVFALTLVLGIVRLFL